jgi:hypothetical protein
LALGAGLVGAAGDRRSHHQTYEYWHRHFAEECRHCDQTQQLAMVKHTDSQRALPFGISIAVRNPGKSPLTANGFDRRSASSNNPL